MKKSSRKSFRTTLRAVMSLHDGYLQDSLDALERGANLGRWAQEMSNEFAAGVELMGTLVKNHNDTHPRRPIPMPKPRRVLP